MKEIVIKNPTRIVNLHNGLDYIPGLYVKVETPEGIFVATCEHRPSAGCVEISREAGDELLLCRNAVLVGSLCKFQKQNGDWPDGCEIPLLSEKDAIAYLAENGIPDDDWATFKNLLSD